MHDAKTQLSALVGRAEAGEEIVIARRNRPAVKLVPVDQETRRQRVPGAYRHLGAGLPEALFLEPLPDDELGLWEGEGFTGDEVGG